MGRQLKGATVGIIGYGVIGEYLGPLCAALGMKVLIADPFKTVAAPGLAQVTQGRIAGAGGFRRLPRHRQRGDREPDERFCLRAHEAHGLFHQSVARQSGGRSGAAAALDTKQIAGAALDVGRAQDQMPQPALAARADVIATPHIAGLTPDAAEHQAFDTVNQVRELLAGRLPPGAANAEHASRWKRLKRA